MPEIKIRHYCPQDRPALRGIAWQTAFMGESADIFFTGKEIFADFLTLYFTDYEPESCFIAEAQGKPVGYLIGAKNTRVMEKVFKAKICLPLFFRALISGIFFHKKNIIFIWRCLKSALAGEFKTPDFSPEYPASLHINIDRQFRGLNIGSKLILAYLDYLRQEGVQGVCLATLSERAGDFFRGQGFILLHSARRSYFRPILRRDTPLYIYGKKL